MSIVQSDGEDNLDDLVRDSEAVGTDNEAGSDNDVQLSAPAPAPVDPPKKARGTRKLIVLNTQRLKNDKGVHTIEKLFYDFQFKGRGREKEDLDKIMKKLEHWCFRLFPKLSFDECLNKIETLGNKKDLQTHLKKYRLDLITADQDCTVEEDDKPENIGMQDDEVVETPGEAREDVPTGSNEVNDRLFDELFNDL